MSTRLSTSQSFSYTFILPCLDFHMVWCWTWYKDPRPFRYHHVRFIDGQYGSRIECWDASKAYSWCLSRPRMQIITPVSCILYQEKVPLVVSIWQIDCRIEHPCLWLCWKYFTHCEQYSRHQPCRIGPEENGCACSPRAEVQLSCGHSRYGDSPTQKCPHLWIYPVNVLLHIPK